MAEICGITPLAKRVAQKNIGVAGQGHHALLDTRSAGIIQADDRRAGLHGHVHDFYDLAGIGF